MIMRGAGTGKGMTMSNAEQAVQLLACEGYEAEATSDGKTVRVMDPVRCTRGSRVWVVYEPRVIACGSGLASVRRWIIERS